MINGCVKGKVGEREWRDELRAEGYLKSCRGQQYSGNSDSPDVVCPELSGFHFEVKRVEKLNLYNAMAQARRDAGNVKLPIVAHRRNREPWLVTMDSATFFRLLRGDSPLDVPAFGDGIEKP
jgi:hypothetical protein